LIKKSKPTWKLKHANYSGVYLEYFCQISSKLILKILSYTVSKLVRFLRHSVEIRMCTGSIDELGDLEIQRAHFYASGHHTRTCCYALTFASAMLSCLNLYLNALHLSFTVT